MDWIGGRISKLIEEGKKALGSEVVVMSDAKEDEVDDGSDAWEEEDQSTGRFSPHKKPRPQQLGFPPSYSPHRGLSSPPSPAVVVPSWRPNISTSLYIARSPSVESESLNQVQGNWKENESDWRSSEIRESMEKARAMYLSKNCR
jgi:hypothetical protein